MENHHFSWENPLFLWPFSIAMLNYQRVSALATFELSSHDLDPPPIHHIHHPTQFEPAANAALESRPQIARLAPNPGVDFRSGMCYGF